MRPKASSVEYYGWRFFGIKVLLLYFKSYTIETTTLVLFKNFGIEYTKIHNLEAVSSE